MFKLRTRKDALKALQGELNVLTETIPPGAVHEKAKFQMQMTSFLTLFKRYVEASEEIDWSKIKVLPDSEVIILLNFMNPKFGNETDTCLYNYSHPW